MTPITGPDISVHNPSFPDLTGQSFVIMRACYGTFKDSKFDGFLGQAKAAGVVTGAYHFGRFGSGKAQAEYFLSVASHAELLVLDLENDAGNPRMTEGQAREFIATVQASGRLCGLYHSLSGYPSLGQDWNWVAAYDGIKVPAKLLPKGRGFHQFTGTGLDRSYFAGTIDDLYKLAGRQQPLPQGDGTVKFATLYADAPLSIEAPAGTSIRDFTGAEIETLPTPTHLAVYGKADAHDGAFVVRVSTSRFYKDGVARPSLAIASIPGGVPA